MPELVFGALLAFWWVYVVAVAVHDGRRDRELFVMAAPTPYATYVAVAAALKRRR